MKKVLMLVIFMIISSILSGCGGGTSSNNRNIQKPTNVTQAKSDSVDVAVYIDGTFSMSGYVNYPSATIYSDGLKKLNVQLPVLGNRKKYNILNLVIAYRILTENNFCNLIM